MSERVERAFERASERGRIALIPFLTVGYPTVEISIDAARAVADAGADVIELGVPFSDPLAEGPVIQLSSHQALIQGVTLETCLNAAKRLRDGGVETPLVFMGYYNPILAYGIEGFCETAAASGADGLIVPDLPTEEAGPLREAAKAAGLDLIPLLALTSPDARIADACADASGFVYCVSVLGTTGARATVSDRVTGLVEKVRSYTTLPAAVGFGIARTEHVAEVARYADGAVFGSALVKLLGEEPGSGAAERARGFFEELSAGALRTGA